ncbi:class I SAM-dependent methyltransferase [Planctomicrobium piriforme]|uniref:Acetylserotonin N-methyltransferase n=1 Tax=Planctomicrobium piriforme TaxID=1576369 RepID=A0A1I3CDF5_9PLAN|nr:class I SAM-dependent methyltransferase [Planctomicrobium piriforme]SFH72575.1 acetylserotonin N-methyltransferase [Planctomicrobium piriforme]
MAHDVSIPDPSPVLDLLSAFRRSKAMFAGVKLGVFDSLSRSPKRQLELAAELQVEETALGRLLDALVGLQLLTRDEDLYASTPAADAYLTSGSPRRMTGYINYSNDVGWRLWEHLEDAVREGTHRWQQTYGWDGPIFSHFFKDDAAKREFLMGMHGFGLISSPHVVTAFDLSRFRHLVDVGGATGHLVIAACERYPELQGTVFDLPTVIPLANEIVAASTVADRIQTVPGDFFADPLPSGDLYFLGRILHDWNEEQSLRLLRTIYAALPTGGALLVGEKLIDEDRRGPDWAQMQDLNMLVCTEGRERTLSEYEGLLKLAGFTDVSGCATGSPLDAILAIK